MVEGGGATLNMEEHLSFQEKTQKKSESFSL